MQGPAVGTGPGALVLVEGGEERWEVGIDGLELEFDPVDEVGTREADPLEPVPFPDGALVLDNQSDRIGIRTLGRVPDAGRKQVEIGRAHV